MSKKVWRGHLPISTDLIKLANTFLYNQLHRKKANLDNKVIWSKWDYPSMIKHDVSEIMSIEP